VVKAAIILKEDRETCKLRCGCKYHLVCLIKKIKEENFECRREDCYITNRINVFGIKLTKWI